MKKIINSLKRTHWFKASGAFLICLFFMSFPSCQKDQIAPDSLLTMDKVAVSASAVSSSSIMYWGRQNFTNGSVVTGICTPYLENFENFVLKVQNVNGGAAKISTLEIRIGGVLILTAKGINRDYLVTKTLRSLSSCAQLTVNLAGDQGCSIDLWIEGTLKLGKVYGRHFYYKTRQPMTWDETNGYIGRLPGFPYPVIINDAKENNFVLNITKDRYFFIGLSDVNHEQIWNWVDGTKCRTVDWRTSSCGTPDPNCPTPWGWGGTDCMIITDYGYNNWDNGQPNNGGGGCGQQYHRDENAAIINWNDKWEDVPTEPGNWGDGNWDNALRNCVLEWNVIPSSDDIYNIFRQEYPEYPYPW
ncbi:MAG: lectin-like protein [Bacteroidota bacterium]